MPIFCDEGEIEDFDFENEEQEAQFQHLLDVYGDREAATRKFHQIYLSDKDQYLQKAMNESPSGTKLIPGFTAKQQQSIVSSVKFLFNKALNAGETNTGNVYSGVRNVLRSQRDNLRDELQEIQSREDLSDDNKRKAVLGKQHRIDEFDKILDNYGDFWKLAVKELESIGLNIDNEGVVEEPGSSFQRSNWDDYARFYVDGKSTSSEKIKRFLSFIPKKSFVRDENGEIEFEDGVAKTRTERNYLGMREYATMDDVYDRINEALSDVVPPDSVDSKFDYMVNELDSRTNNPQIEEAIARLKSIDNESLKSDFVNAFGKSYDREQMVLFKPQTNEEGEIRGYSLITFNSNRNDQVARTKEQWYENQKTLPITRLGPDNEMQIDTEAVEEIRKEYLNSLNKLAEGSTYSTVANNNKEELLPLVQNTLAKLGITVPIDALENIQENPDNLYQKGSFTSHIAPIAKDNTFHDDYLMGIIFNTFTKGSQDAEIDELQKYSQLGTNNPVYGKDSQGIIQNLARVAAEHSPRVYSPSFMNVENNQIHALQDHTALTREFAMMRQEPDSILRDRGAYDQNSQILQAYQNNDLNIRNIINLEYLDGLKRFNRSQGITHGDMGTVDKHLTKLSLFQGAQRNNRVKLMSPTLSDKSRDYIVTLPPIYKFVEQITNANSINSWLHNNEVSIDSNGNISKLSKNSVPVQLMSYIAKAEADRITELQNMLREEDMSIDDHPLGSDYAENGQRFFLFPELNPNNLDKETRNTIWSNTSNESGDVNWRFKGTSQAWQAIQEKLQSRIRSEINKTKTTWENLGIINNQNDIFDQTYLRKSVPVRGTARKRTYAAIDFTLSSMFFNAEMTKVLAGDPALHVDAADTGDFNDTVTQTINNLQKRQANQIAPAITNSLTGKVSVATLEDRYVDSKNLEEYQGLLSERFARAYSSDQLESSDAQEYTTVREHVNMMFAHGNISQDLRDRVINKIDSAKENDSKPTNYYELSQEEIEKLQIVPHKPVIVSRKYHPELGSSGTSAWLYRKSSSFPLLPQLTQGMDIDNLRVAMENKNVDRVAFKSADKTGDYNRFNAFNNDERKTFKDYNDLEDLFVTKEEADNPLSATVQKINRRDVGLQFELPLKKPGITTLTQLNKFLTQEVKDLDGFEFQGEEMTGRELEEKKQEIRTQMFETAKEELFNDLGVVVQPNEDTMQVRIEDKQRLQEILLREAEDRDWGPAAIDSLELDENQEDFVIPFSFSPAAKNIESLLLSLIENRVINKELYGKSFVQASVTGFHAQSNNTGITTFEDHNPEEGLKHLRIEDGETEAVEVYIPWSYTDNEGNLLNMSNYTKEIETEDGTREVIDEEKFDPALREIVSARLPNQGPSSMMPVKVAGFLPPAYNKLMIVSEETVPQMGSDFDVDKLYSYMSKHTYDPETEEINKATQEDLSELEWLKEQYKQIKWSALTHPEQIDRVIKPLDLPYLNNNAEEIQDTRVDDVGAKNYLSPVDQIEDHNNQHAGKKLIGIFSNYSTLNAILEMYPQRMATSAQGPEGSIEIPMVVRATTDDGDTIELTRVGGTGATVDTGYGEEVSVADVIKMYQNASVDNAKELVLDKLNATTDTADVIATLSMLNNGNRGIPLESLTRLFVQDSIINFQEQLDNLRSQTNDEFVEDFEGEALERTRRDILSNFDTETQDKIQERVAEASVIRDNEGVPQKNIRTRIPSPSSLQSDLENNKTLDNEDYAVNQLKHLETYESLLSIRDALKSIQGAANYGDRNGAGPSLIHAESKTEALNDLRKGQNQVFPDVADVVDGTEWEASGENSFELAWKLYADQFHYDKEIFQKIREEYKKIQGEDTNPDKVLEMFREMKSFVFSTKDMWDNPEGERRRLLMGTDSIEDIATRVKNAQESWGQDDFFIQRLRPEIPEVEGEPAVVNFSAEKAERTDDLRIIQNIAGLLTSKDAKKRLLMEDLVKYSYLSSGGIQTPNSFSQYIPIQYLTEFGLGDAIDNFDFENLDGEANNFMNQYFQHNPSDAEVLNRDFVNNNIRKGNGSLPTTIKNSREYDEMTYEVTNGNGGTRIELVPYVSLYDQENFQWRLYKAGPDGNSHYRIDTLGNDSIREYQVGEEKLIQGSMIEENRTDLSFNPWNNPEDVQAQMISDPQPSKANKENVDKPIHRMKDGDQKNAEDFFTEVKRMSNNPFNVKLANLLDQERFRDVQIRINNNLGSAARAYSDRNLVELSNPESRTLDDNHTHVLHELIHKATYDVLNAPGNELTQGEKDALGDLRSLFETVQSRMKNRFGPQKWQEVMDKVERAKETDNNTYLTREEKLIYSASNFNEFVAQSMTNREFQKELDKIEGEKGGTNSLLDEFLKYIQDLFVALGNNIGIENLRRDSALIESISNTVKLIDSKKRNRPDNPTQEAKESEANKDINYEDIMDAADQDFDTQSMNQTIGEFRKGLSNVDKNTFDQIRSRIITKC